MRTSKGILRTVMFRGQFLKRARPCTDPLFGPLCHAHRLGYGTGVEHDDRPFRPSSTQQKGTPATSLARVQFFSVSLDGFGTGVGLSHDAPFGHAGDRMHEWMFVTRWWREMVGEPGGSGGIDDALLRLHDPGIGAEIMGAGKFGYPGWHEDPAWKGWWGDEPPFHTPVFVLTHHPRPSIELQGGTTFHFVDASPAEALETAR